MCTLTTSKSQFKNIHSEFNSVAKLLYSAHCTGMFKDNCCPTSQFTFSLHSSSVFNLREDFTWQFESFLFYYFLKSFQSFKKKEWPFWTGYSNISCDMHTDTLMEVSIIQSWMMEVRVVTATPILIIIIGIGRIVKFYLEISTVAGIHIHSGTAEKQKKKHDYLTRKVCDTPVSI